MEKLYSLVVSCPALPNGKLVSKSEAEHTLFTVSISIIFTVITHSIYLKVKLSPYHIYISSLNSFWMHFDDRRTEQKSAMEHS